MKKILLFVLLVVSKSSFSAPETFSPTFVGCFPSGTCYIGVSPSSSTTTCEHKSQIRIDITLPGSKEQYSAALTALAAGKKIHTFVTDTCIDGYPTPSYFQVNK